jgi:predicted RNA-binding protein YlxR (DUF448 family)
MKKRSERTCCVCRSKGGKEELARLVFADGALVWDRDFGAPGRGAYVHRHLECLSKFSQVARWERSLRLTSGTLKAAQVSELARLMLESVEK